MIARPFVKWAGGKNQLIQDITKLFPKRVRTYYEPFLGGGAIYFALVNQNRFDRAMLSDSNRELINAFRVVRDFPEDLMLLLRENEVSYQADPKPYYLGLREQDATELDPVEQAARFITLNKATYNGLYRVNKQGKFNAPWGKRPKLKLFDEAKLRACSAALNQWVQFHNGDFESLVKDAQEGDAVYFDPPYVPLNATANFTNYTRAGFTMADHVRLAELFKRLYEKGVAAILSNSDTPEVRALYTGFEMYEVEAKRAINSKGERRGPIGELLIVNRRQSLGFDMPPPEALPVSATV